MRTSTLILSLTTATFAMSTAYLAWELHESYAVPAVSGASTAQASTPPTPDRGSSGTSATQATLAAGAGNSAKPDPTAPAAVAGAAITSQGAGAGKRIDLNDPGTVFARQLVARLDDSTQRQVLLDEQKATVRRQYARLKEQLNLSDVKFEQLVTTLAEQNLQAQENWARCAVDASCDPKDESRARFDDRTQELLALLGQDAYEDFASFRETLQERDAVAQLRGRLTDNLFLPQAQAEQLITALADERKRFAQEATARGSNLSGFGTSLGMIMYPEDAVTIEARLAEATLYSQRMRSRAASVLSAAQLAAYVQMQDELLAQLATFLRPPPSPTPRKANSLKLAQG